jgi:hypothetical protein
MNWKSCSATGGRDLTYRSDAAAINLRIRRKTADGPPKTLGPICNRRRGLTAIVRQSAGAISGTALSFRGPVPAVPKVVLFALQRGERAIRMQLCAGHEQRIDSCYGRDK